MAEVLRHRGPDSAGDYSDLMVALAMRRLAIQDVAHGHQPVFSEDRSIVGIQNGEIYNFRELARELTKRGHRLASSSDTEVIPHLYEEYGDAFVERLRGMFAIALWDTKRQRLLLVRDRVGKKPLYWWCAGTTEIRFASEIKALFADPGMSREPDLAAIHRYLTLQYVPPPLTAFVGIESLRPAHMLIADGKRITVEPWWTRTVPASRSRPAVQDAPALVRGAVIDATRARMVADVPLGAFLSGGIDSACVVASMAMSSPEPVRTFTIGFSGESGGFTDERALAAEVAGRFGTDHTEHVVEPDAASLMPLLAWHFDQPFGDSSCLPTFSVAQVAREHVTVALTGDGGDEAFAGYDRSRRIAISQAARPRLRLPFLDLLPHPSDAHHPLARGRRYLLRRFGDLKAAYASWAEIYPEAALRRIYTEDMRAATVGIRVRDTFAAAMGGTGDALDRLLAAEYGTYLPGDLLPKLDVATMAVSLEARSPLLDQDVVALAASLPSAAKIGPDGAKLALRNAFRGDIPDAVLDGPKRGFSVPIARWLRTDLVGTARALLLSDSTAVARLVLPTALARLVDDHVSGRADHGDRLFPLMMLELWFRIFIEAAPSSTPPSSVTLRDLS